LFPSSSVPFQYACFPVLMIAHLIKTCMTVMLEMEYAYVCIAYYYVMPSIILVI
jgi:hypothetical protein